MTNPLIHTPISRKMKQAAAGAAAAVIFAGLVLIILATVLHIFIALLGYPVGPLAAAATLIATVGALAGWFHVEEDPGHD